MSRFITGTIAQLTPFVTVNGRNVNQPELSMLSRLLEGKGFTKVGVIKKEFGRPAIIWKVDTKASLGMEIDPIL